MSRAIYAPVLTRPLSEMDDATVLGLQREVCREASNRRMHSARWWNTWNAGRAAAASFYGVRA